MIPGKNKYIPEVQTNKAKKIILHLFQKNAKEFRVMRAL
jgi:hypothetical protein